MSIANPSPPPAPPWPEQSTGHPFDTPEDDYTPPSPDQVLASINEICHGWKARRFRGHFCAALRGPDRVTVVWGDDVFALTMRIAEVNAGRLT